MATLEGTACDDDPALEMSGSFSHQDTQFKRIGLNDALVFKEVLISRIEIYKILVNTAKFLKGMVGGQWQRKQDRCSTKSRLKIIIKVITFHHSCIFLITVMPNICHHKIHLFLFFI